MLIRAVITYISFLLLISTIQADDATTKQSVNESATTVTNSVPPVAGTGSNEKVERNASPDGTSTVALNATVTPPKNAPASVATGAAGTTNAVSGGTTDSPGGILIMTETSKNASVTGALPGSIPTDSIGNTENGNGTGATEGNSEIPGIPGFPPTDGAGVTGESSGTDEISAGSETDATGGTEKVGATATDEFGGTGVTGGIAESANTGEAIGATGTTDETGSTEESAGTGETAGATGVTGENGVTIEGGASDNTEENEGTEASVSMSNTNLHSTNEYETDVDILTNPPGTEAHTTNPPQTGPDEEDTVAVSSAEPLTTNDDETDNEPSQINTSETNPEESSNDEATENYTTKEEVNTTPSPTEPPFPTQGEIEETEEPESPDTSDLIPPTCDSIIYCQGKLLHTVQMARIFDDSKHFVDMSMKNDPGAIMAKFEEMMNETDGEPSKSRIQKFVEENFKSEAEVLPWTPEDYNESPCFLTDIADQDVQNFATKIIGMWKTLGRKVADDVFYYPDKHSLIPLPYGFISSGGRYGEYHYWDNYWIADALIICGMTDTVKGMIDNFVTMIIKYGFVPNGGRKYYARRSQPPLLPFIVMRYYEETTDILWLQSYIEYFEQEMQFWMNKRKTHIVIDSNVYSLWLYMSDSKGPRPEAYYEDVTAADYYTDEEEKQHFYNNIKASAESGWDSSSRWVFDVEGGTNANLTFSKPSRIVPVDLNAYLYGAFTIMSKLYLDLENYGKQSFWRQRANELYTAINKIFWNDEDGIWYDYDLDFETHRKNFYVSNLAPLWTNAYNMTWCKKQRQVHQIIEYLNKYGVLDYPGGIPSSLKRTGKQWDKPNVWPPMQSIIANGFYRTGIPEAKTVAKNIAKKFVTATMKSYESGAMYQRYDADNVGEPGPDGEYETQKVFAWTNAVAIQFIHRFYIEY